jgi:hypothetical protein
MSIVLLCALVAALNILWSSKQILKGVQKLTKNNPSSPSSIVHIPDFILNDASSPINADAAMNFILERKQVYKDRNRLYSWPLRGIGYLYEQHGVILAGKYTYVTSSKKHSVHIRNVQEKNVNCSDIVIWVRVNGPNDIFAGQAQAVHTPANLSNDRGISGSSSECHWEFDFDARVSGSYNIDAKLLEFQPNVPRPIQCPLVTTNASIVEPFPVRTSFLGFKMYRVKEMCCEICSRLAGHCKAWATPIPAFPRGPKTFARQGCELYFENETSLGVIPISPMIAKLNRTNHTEFDVPVEQHEEKVYGLPHHNDTSYFLGCGWNYWFTLDFPCLSGALDDNIFFGNDTVELIDVDETSTMALIKRENATLEESSLCSIESESFANHSGRWVREPWPTEEECPHPYQTIDKPLFGSEGYSFDDGSPSKIYGNDDPNCFRRDDHLSFYDHTCIEMNCAMIEPSSLWKSWLHEERKWNGHWKHDSGCSYRQYTGTELQQCIDRRKLHGFEVEGRSIGEMIRGYLTQRFENITFYNNTELNDGTTVTISTFGILHYCYEPERLKEFFEDAPNVTGNEEFFWVSGYFLSSEREILCLSSRLREFSVLGENYLTPKGYKMINAYDMTAAMTYDTAAQRDGMHINGPPLRMILTKILHYLCSDE